MPQNYLAAHIDSIIVQEKREGELTTKFGYRHLIWFADQISNKRGRRGDEVPLWEGPRATGFGFGLSHEYSSSLLTYRVPSLSDLQMLAVSIS